MSAVFLSVSDHTLHFWSLFCFFVNFANVLMILFLKISAYAIEV